MNEIRIYSHCLLLERDGVVYRYVSFDVLLTVHLGINLVINLMHKILFYIKFIIWLYMFRALLCSSSGGQNCVIQHLVSSCSVGGRPVHLCTGLSYTAPLQLHKIIDLKWKAKCIDGVCCLSMRGHVV